MRFVAIITLCAGILGIATPSARADEPASLVILPFDNATGRVAEDPLRDGVADLLTACIATFAEHIAVVDRGVLNDLIETQRLARTGLTREDFRQQAGRLTGASHLLAGSFARSPDGLRVQALLYDAATTQLVFSTDASGSAERLPELLCEHIAPAIAANLNESKGDQSLLTVDRDPVYNQLLITGLGNFYAGDLAAAFPAFMKILRDHPDDEAARYWLAKSFHEAEMPHFAVIEMNKYLNQHPDSPRRPEIEALLRQAESSDHE